MCRLIVCLLFLGALVCAPVRAQQSGDSLADTASTAPPPPTPEQDRYLHGLRTAGRGVAQLKNGIDRVVRAKNVGDTAQVRQAGRRLAGLCVAARGFLVSGRSRMALNAWETPVRKPARVLALQIDSLTTYATTCEHQAGKTPQQTSAALMDQLRGYEEALADFRSAIGLPNH